MPALSFFTLSLSICNYQLCIWFVIISRVYGFNLHLFSKIQRDGIFRSSFLTEARNEDVVSSSGAQQLSVVEIVY